MSPEELLAAVGLIARRASCEVMAVYATEFQVRRKPDASPVTEADERAEALIAAALLSLTPHIPVVAEEAVAGGRLPRVDGQFWLVDALDGTREFISRNGAFTVNIALVQEGAPVLGVVVAPALGRLFAGAQGVAAYAEDALGTHVLRCRPVPASGLTVVTSRAHGDATALRAFLTARNVTSHTEVGSSLKFCRVAGGEADLYPRLGRTMEWDTAAGHAVLVAAGGQVTDLAGRALRYGKPGFENPHFIASGAPF